MVFGTVEEEALAATAVDAASITSNNTRKFVEGIMGLNLGTLRYFSKDIIEDELFDNIFKVGAGTGEQIAAFVSNPHANIKAPELMNNDFVDVIETSKEVGNNAVTAEGDSGSVLIGDIDGETVVFGLNFAMSTGGIESYAFPSGRVTDALSIDIPGNRQWPRP